MTELINPHPVHWAGVGLEQRRIHGSEDRPDPSSRAAQFSKTIRRSRRVSPPPTLSRGPQKRPLVVRGPIWGRRLPAESGVLATRLLLLGTVARATEKYSQPTQEGRVADPASGRLRRIARKQRLRARAGGRSGASPPAGPGRRAPRPADRGDPARRSR